MSHRHPLDSRLSLSPQTQVLGLLGEGISYSLSPLIHNASSIKLGIDAIYLPFDLSQEKIPSFLEILRGIDQVKGFNVTKPHKQIVAKTLGSDLKAVNTVYRSNKEWRCCTTDGLGFIHALNRMNVDCQDLEKVVILGSGGVVHSLIEDLQTQNKSLAFVICRRTALNDKSFINDSRNLSFGPLELGFLTKNLAPPNQKTLLIQATSAPLNGESLGFLVPSLKSFNGVFVDLLYGQTSALYHEAIKRNLKTQDGLPMLIEQARLSQIKWWGQAASYEFIASHLRNTD